MRRTSVPRPKDRRRQSKPMPGRGSMLNGDTKPGETGTISEENKENIPENVENENKTIDKNNDSDRYEDVDMKDNDNQQQSENTNLNKDNQENSYKKKNEIEEGGGENEMKDLSENTDAENSLEVKNVDDSSQRNIQDNVDLDGKDKDDDGNVDSFVFNEDIARKDNGIITESEDQVKSIDENIDDKKDKTGVDVTDNDVHDERLVDEKRVLSENELEEEWKKLTEDPNYPSIPTMEDLTPRRRHQPPPTNQTTDSYDVTRMTTNPSRQTISVPPLHIPESVRWTHQPKPTYTSSRAVTDISVPYSHFSYQNKHPSHHQYTTHRRRHSIPRPLPSSKEPYNSSYLDTNNKNNIYNDRSNSFMDDNSMLISARKLDSLLFRLFYKSQTAQTTSNYPAVTDTKRDHVIAKTQETSSTLPILFEHSGSDIISMDPVTWHLRPMGATEKETLQSELPYLEENLEPKEVIKKLFMDGAITHLDYNQLTHTEGQGCRAVTRLLIGTLQRRGEGAYPAFMLALKDLSYTRIYDKLYSTRRELSRGMDDDRDELERRTRMGGVDRGSLLPTYRTEPISRDTINPYMTNHVPTSSAAGDNRLDTITTTPPSQQHPQATTATATDGNSSSTARGSNREEYDKEVEKQLTELNAELKALHEDINTLRSSRAGTSQDGQLQNNGQKNQQPQQKSSSCIIL